MRKKSNRTAKMHSENRQHVPKIDVAVPDIVENSRAHVCKHAATKENGVWFGVAVRDGRRR